jgi:hypothetical protein
MKQRSWLFASLPLAPPLVLVMAGAVGAQSLRGWYVMNGDHTVAAPFGTYGECGRVERQTRGFPSDFDPRPKGEQK